MFWRRTSNGRAVFVGVPSVSLSDGKSSNDILLKPVLAEFEAGLKGIAEEESVFLVNLQ